jgi:uncharacterized membrane protein YbaN (DUF454 family)
MKKTDIVGSLSGKLIACVLVVACVAVGAIGLVLPIIPGLLFLAIAAFIAARHFPSIDALLRRNRAIGKHINRADAFLHLSLAGKFQLAGWLCAKMLLDSLALIGSLAAKPGGASRRNS